MAKTFPKERLQGKHGIVEGLDGDFEQILISAERYALGRRSGIVILTIRYIGALLPGLTDCTLAVILKDIDEQERMGMSFGMDFDEKAWKQLREEIKKEQEKRKHG